MKWVHRLDCCDIRNVKKQVSKSSTKSHSQMSPAHSKTRSAFAVKQFRDGTKL